MLDGFPIYVPGYKANFYPFSRIPPGFPVYPPKNIGEIGEI
jgi:hypothetical protein